MTTQIINISDEILNSWKEIASYVNRGVRTVQRWEAELGLPVRRPGAKSHSAVIAMRSEIDSWLQSRPTKIREPQEAAGAPSPNLHADPSTAELVLACEHLRNELRELRVEFLEATEELSAMMQIVLNQLSRIGEEVQIDKISAVA